MQKFDSDLAPCAQSEQVQARRSRWGVQRSALAAIGVLGTLTLLLLAGCPGNLENAQTYNIDNPDQPAQAGSNGVTQPGLDVDTGCLTTIFKASCVTVGCHGATTPAAGLDLDSPGVNKRLINVLATHQLAMPNTGCVANQKLIDAANPDASWLVGKLTTDGSTCGLRMPVGPMLSADQIACATKYAHDVAAAAGTAPGGMAGSTGMAMAGSPGSAGASASAGSGSGGTSATAGGGGM